MNPRLLYLTTVLIWGTTWFVIKFQLGTVPPELSIAYRFFLASLILIGYCLARRYPLRYSFREHGFMMLQGFLLFSLNYFLFYLATFYLTTGLNAVIFSTLSMMNILTGALFFGIPIQTSVVVGAITGLSGIAFIFLKDLLAFDLSTNSTKGLLLALTATLVASFGNQIAARNQRQGLPVLQTNAFGMGYGALFMFIVALIQAKPFSFEASFLYTTSLLYLSLFGSVIAFGCYLTLIGQIGAARAAYATVLFPLVALTLSSLYEGYQWTLKGFIGICLILAGSVIILRTKRPNKV